MFKEMRGMEYILEALRAFHNNPGRHDSKGVHNLIGRGGRVEASLSYVQKILPRMVKLGLLVSSESGYALAKSINDVTVDDVLAVNDMPLDDSPLYGLCIELKKTVAGIPIGMMYNFDR